MSEGRCEARRAVPFRDHGAAQVGGHRLVGAVSHESHDPTADRHGLGETVRVDVSLFEVGGGRNAVLHLDPALAFLVVDEGPDLRAASGHLELAIWTIAQREVATRRGPAQGVEPHDESTRGHRVAALDDRGSRPVLVDPAGQPEPIEPIAVGVLGVTCSRHEALRGVCVSAQRAGPAGLEFLVVYQAARVHLLRGGGGGHRSGLRGSDRTPRETVVAQRERVAVLERGRSEQIVRVVTECREGRAVQRQGSGTTEGIEAIPPIVHRQLTAECVEETYLARRQGPRLGVTESSLDRAPTCERHRAPGQRAVDPVLEKLRVPISGHRGEQPRCSIRQRIRGRRAVVVADV